MRVLVATSSSADDRKTLAVRALGRSGAWVAVGADQALCAPAFSRYCARRVRYPNPAAEGAAFVDALLSEVSRGGYDVLLPLCDYTTMLASRHEGELRSHVGLAVPAYAALAQAHDKVRALRVARRAGVRTPATHAPRDVEAARALADAVSYPCVVKLRRGAGGVGLRFAASPSELRRCLDAWAPRRDLVFDDRPVIWRPRWRMLGPALGARSEDRLSDPLPHVVQAVRGLRLVSFS